MCGVELCCQLVTKGWKVRLCEISHVFEPGVVVMIEEFVAQGIDLPREALDNVDVEVLQGQL